MKGVPRWRVVSALRAARPDVDQAGGRLCRSGLSRFACSTSTAWALWFEVAIVEHHRHTDRAADVARGLKTAASMRTARRRGRWSSAPKPRPRP